MVGFRKWKTDDFKNALEKSDIAHGSFFNPKTGRNIELIGHSSTDKKNNKKGKGSKNWASLRRNMLKKNLLDEVKMIDASIEKLAKMPYRDLVKMRKDAGVKVRAGKSKKNKIPEVVKPVVSGESQTEEYKNKLKKGTKIVSKEVSPGKVVAKEVAVDVDPSAEKLKGRQEAERARGQRQRDIQRDAEGKEKREKRFGDFDAPHLDKSAGNIRQNIKIKIEEKEQEILEEKVEKVSQPHPPTPTHQAEGSDTHVGAPTASLPVAKRQGDPTIGEGPLIGQTGGKGIRRGRGSNKMPLEGDVRTESMVDVPRDTEVVEVERGPIQPMISGAFKQEAEVAQEARSRIQKTERDLKTEIMCFRALFRELIKDPLFKALNSQSLSGKSITQLRMMHEQYSEIVREYYEKGRGLKIGVIVDPQVLNLNLMGLQQMFSNQMDNSNRVVSSSANVPRPFKGTPSGKVVKSSDNHEPTKRTMVGDIHYARGGLAVSQQKPPQAEMRGLAKGLDLNKRNHIEVSIGKKAVPKSFINYKNYMIPARRERMNTNIKIGKR